MLPEFFTTGMAYLPQLHDAALPLDGAAARLLLDLARRHAAIVGGSFLCRDDDGEVRNAFLLAGPEGPLGRHDKDLPTMWENAFYVPGHDDGLIALPDGRAAGVALCWELIRSATGRRLRGRVDVAVGGSCWWSVPPWRPQAVTGRWEAANARNASRAPQTFARLVGAPVIHAAHCGPVSCRMPGTPIPYRGHYEGQTMIVAADGEVVGRRGPDAGPGVVVADLPLGRRVPAAPLPDRYWLTRRGPLPSLAWRWQRSLGRREYARHHPSAVRS